MMASRCNCEELMINDLVVSQEDLGRFCYLCG